MTEYSFRAAFHCGPLLVSLCLLFFLRQIWHRCQSQVSDHQMRLSFFIPRKPFETQILSLSLPPSHFPSCCCWHPFGLYKSKWASATHCVPACRAHFGFQAASRGTGVIPTALPCDGYPSGADVCPGMLLFWTALSARVLLIRPNSSKAVAFIQMWLCENTLPWCLFRCDDCAGTSMLSIWSKLESEIEQVIGHCGSAPHYAEMLIGSGLRIRFAFFLESSICCGGQGAVVRTSYNQF